MTCVNLCWRQPVTLADICDVARSAIGEDIVSTAVLGGGRNSRVFSVMTPARSVVVKYYFQNPGDPRDRQWTECSALSFMAAHGVACVPEVLHVDREAGFTLLTHVDGERITDAGMTSDNEQEFLSFVGDLKRISLEPDATQLAPASEAFFMLDGVIDNIKQRLDRLHGRSANLPLVDALDSFLETRFSPALEALSSRAKVYYRDAGFNESQVLDEKSRVLSPSDFGLHNSIRSSEGLVFLDFEYFGWDDPVKMVSDFALHPAQGVLGDERLRLASAMLGLFNDQPEIEKRFRALFPLFGLKWCMILLNEFIAGDNARRVFSGSDDDYESVLERQLAKAEEMLTRAENDVVLDALVATN